MLGDQLLEGLELGGGGAALLQRALSFPERSKIAPTLIHAAGQEVQGDPVEQSAPAGSRAADELKIARMKHDDRCSCGIARKPGGSLAVQAHRSAPRANVDLLFSAELAIRHRDAYHGGLLPVSNDLAQPLRPEASTSGDDVQSFEEGGLPLPIVAGNHVQPRCRLHLDVGNVTESANRNSLKYD
jgi:hypothetical protein